jgi:Cu/Ag efflux protein CusF
MAKLLKDVLKGVKSSTKKVNDLGGYAPKPGDEQKFAKKHDIEVHADRAGNGDDVYKGKTKETPYNKQSDGVYEAKEAEDAQCNSTPKGTPCPVHGMNECMTVKKINETDSGFKDALPNIIKDIKAKKSAQELRQTHGTHYKRVANAASNVHGPKYTRAHLLDVAQTAMKEEVELDEVSKDTLQRYRHAAKSERMHPEKGEQRKVGMGLALKKILGSDKIGNKPKVKATKEEVEVNEVLTKSTTAGETIHDFVHSKNPKFAGKSKEKRKEMALAAYYAKQRNEETITEVNNRDYAAKGKMHPDMAKSMKVGQEGDFYAHGTGDKVYGKVIHNNGKTIHIKQSHDSYSDKKVSKTHKFNITPHLGEDLAVPLLGGDSDSGVSMVKAELKALAAYYAKQRNEEAGESDENFNEAVAPVPPKPMAPEDIAKKYSRTALHGDNVAGMDRYNKHLSNWAKHTGTTKDAVHKQVVAHAKKMKMHEETITDLDMPSQIVYEIFEETIDEGMDFGAALKKTMSALSAAKEHIKRGSTSTPAQKARAHIQHSFLTRQAEYLRKQAAQNAGKRNPQPGVYKKRMREDLAVPLLGGDDDNGVSMVKAELKALANKAMHLVTQMPDSMHVEPWVQAKIAQAKAYVSDVHDYCVYGDHDKEKENETMDTPMTFPNMSVDVNTGQNV